MTNTNANISIFIDINRDIRFVQFPHPGGEHITDYVKKTEKNEKYHHWSKTKALEDSVIPWNRGLHRRKFMKNQGEFIDDRGELSLVQDIMFWGEWEPSSKFKKINYLEKVNFREEGLPQYIHERLLADDASYQRENTDPYIFGDKFHYCVCKQKVDKNPNQLYMLEKGSIILFGSCIKKMFRLDALFVVSDSDLYQVSDVVNLKQKHNLSDMYYKASLKPLIDGTSDNVKSNEHMYYTGATYRNPLEINGEKIFSFFPCKAFQDGEGFSRPIISFDPEHEPISKIHVFKFDNKKAIGYSCTIVNPDQVIQLWDIVKKQVLAQGLSLGIWTEEPK